jgi:tellurite resistance protein
LTAALHGRTWAVGERVLVRQSGAVQIITALRNEKDEAQVPYVMADLVAENGGEKGMAETTWLRPAPPKTTKGQSS